MFILDKFNRYIKNNQFIGYQLVNAMEETKTMVVTRNSQSNVQKFSYLLQITFH